MATVGAAQNGIKAGLLFDFVFPPPSSWDVKSDFTDALRLTFEESSASGLLDRSVELVERSVEGLPRGAVKPVIDAYQELVDEGCVIVIGPLISENMVALKEHIERSGFVPALAWGGTEDWLGRVDVRDRRRRSRPGAARHGRVHGRGRTPTHRCVLTSVR